MPERVTEETMARLRELLAKATPGPWYLDNEPRDRAENAQCVVTSREDDHGHALFDTFNRGYKESGITEEHDEGKSYFYDTRGEADLALVVALHNAAPALLDTIDRQQAENAALVRVTKQLIADLEYTGYRLGQRYERFQAASFHGHAGSESYPMHLNEADKALGNLSSAAEVRDKRLKAEGAVEAAKRCLTICDAYTLHNDDESDARNDAENIRHDIAMEFELEAEAARLRGTGE